MIQAQIVADSLSPQGHRLFSVLVTFPRIILAEVNTHRMLSKNTASSRAIPFKKMIEAVRTNPFIPIAWQKEHKGMQGTEYWTDQEYIDYFTNNHLDAADYAAHRAEKATANGLTKQIANRYLEPFMWTTMLITGSKEGWDNFFNLRCPQYEIDVPTVNDNLQENGSVKIVSKSKKQLLKEIDSLQNSVYAELKEKLHSFSNLEWLQINKGQAEIHMMALAEAIYDARNESTPKQLQAGEWHIPFGDKIHIDGLQGIQFTLKDGSTEYHEAEWITKARVKISTAMAARTSYTVVGDEKEFTIQQQIALHDRMANQVPFHASPFEHCARAMNDEEYYSSIKTSNYPVHLPVSEEDYQSNGGIVNKELYPQHTEYGKNIDYSMYGWNRNFRGFIQYRHILESNQ